MSNKSGYFNQNSSSDHQNPKEYFILRFNEKSELCVKLRRSKIDQIVMIVRRQQQDCYYEGVFSHQNVPVLCIRAFQSIEGLFHYIQNSYKENIEIEYTQTQECYLFLKDSIGKRPKTYKFIIERKQLNKFDKLTKRWKELLHYQKIKKHKMEELIKVISTQMKILEAKNEENTRLRQQYERCAKQREILQQSIHILNEKQASRAKAIQQLKAQQEVLIQRIRQLSIAQVEVDRSEIYMIDKPPSKKRQNSQIHSDLSHHFINEEVQTSPSLISFRGMIASPLEPDQEDAESQSQPQNLTIDIPNKDENIFEAQKKSSLENQIIQHNNQELQLACIAEEAAQQAEYQIKSEESNKQNVPISDIANNSLLENQQIQQAINFTFAPKKAEQSNMLQFSKILTEEIAQSNQRILEEVNSSLNPNVNISASFLHYSSGSLQFSGDEENVQRQYGKKINLNFSRCHNLKDYELIQVQNNEKILKMISKEGVFSYLYHKRSIKGMQYFAMKVQNIKHNDFDFGIRGYDSLNVPRIEWHENIVCFAGSIHKLVNRCLFRDLSREYDLQIGDEIIVSVDMEMRKFRVFINAILTEETTLSPYIPEECFFFLQTATEGNQLRLL